MYPLRTIWFFFYYTVNNVYNLGAQILGQADIVNNESFKLGVLALSLLLCAYFISCSSAGRIGGHKIDHCQPVWVFVLCPSPRLLHIHVFQWLQNGAS